MTGNGSCYSHLFKTAIKHIGAKQIHTKPHTPRTNGKAERFIQTGIKEWPTGKPIKPLRKATGGWSHGWIITTGEGHTPHAITNRRYQDWLGVNNVLENNSQPSQKAPCPGIIFQRQGAFVITKYAEHLTAPL